MHTKGALKVTSVRLYRIARRPREKVRDEHVIKTNDGERCKRLKRGGEWEGEGWGKELGVEEERGGGGGRGMGEEIGGGGGKGW